MISVLQLLRAIFQEQFDPWLNDGEDIVLQPSLYNKREDLAEVQQRNQEILRLSETMSNIQLGQQFDMHPGSIRAILRTLGAPFKPRVKRTSQVLELYPTFVALLKQGQTPKSISKQYQAHISHIYRAADQANFLFPRSKKFVISRNEQILNLYNTTDISIKQLAQQFNIHDNGIYEIVRASERYMNQVNNKRARNATIRQLAKTMLVKDIAKKFNLHRHTVRLIIDGKKKQ